MTVKRADKQYNEFCLIHWRQSQCGGKRYKYLGFGIYESGIGKETGVRHMSYQVKLKVKEILEERKITQKSWRRYQEYASPPSAILCVGPGRS